MQRGSPQDPRLEAFERTELSRALAPRPTPGLLSGVPGRSDEWSVRLVAEPFVRTVTGRAHGDRPSNRMLPATPLVAGNCRHLESARQREVF